MFYKANQIESPQNSRKGQEEAAEKKKSSTHSSRWKNVGHKVRGGGNRKRDDANDHRDRGEAEDRRTGTGSVFECSKKSHANSSRSYRKVGPRGKWKQEPTKRGRMSDIKPSHM